MAAPPSERSYTLDEIVQQAESLDGDDRLRYLTRVCAQDSDLLAQALQRLQQSSPQWWDHSIESRAFDPADKERERTGESIGPYRVIRQLGQGGMGDVLLAERDDKQFRQQVAIKLVKSGALSRNVQGRLKAERQILATLDHPSIARLFDGGTTADGTPYIVMEYIDGEAIDVYCDSRKLTLDARLLLFRSVCSAVHSAHQNLIVHRDLKPSNILVTRDGTPKLLDFGIAKVLDDRKMMHTMAVTQLDVRVMTPEHASPEQIRGEPITTASDIYALGVLLYELLTGHKPYRIKSSRLSEIEDAICEQAPLPLNAGLPFRREAADRETLETCSARSSTPAKLRRDLSGDLATVVMTALRKEPERRYSSALQLSDDIDRYMNGMPIAAAKDSWQYRAGKFVRRHTIAVAASTLAIVGLVAFAIVTTVQAQRIARERARAEQISSFLIDMFEQADPSRSRGKDITVREILDVGSRKIETELAEQPDTRASLLATVGKVYGDLGLYDNSEQMLRESLSTRMKLYGPRDPQTADAMLRLGDALMKREQFSQAAPLLADALIVNRREFGDDSLRVAANLRSLGVLKRNQQEIETAETLLRESLKIIEAQPSRPYSELSATLNNLALLLENKGDNEGAADLYRRSIAATEKALGHDHPTVAYNSHNLAVSLQKQGKLEEAAPLFSESLKLYRKLFGDEHPETLAALANYGVFLQRRQDLDGAEKVLREVLALDQKVRGENHSYVGYDRVNLGLLLAEKQLHSQAESEYRAALDIYKQSLPATHRFVGGARRSLGLALTAQNRHREAEQELKKALEIFRTSFPDDNPQVASTQGALGQTLARQKRFAEAEPLLRGGYEKLLAARGTDNPNVIRMRGWIEELYKEWNKPVEAALFFASLPPPKEPKATP